MSDIFFNKGLNISGSSSSLVDLYQAPTDKKAVVIGLQVANAGTSTSSNANVSVALYDNSEAAQYYIIRNAVIPPTTSLEVISGKLVLESGDKIVVGNDNISDTSYIISVMII